MHIQFARRDGRPGHCVLMVLKSHFGRLLKMHVMYNYISFVFLPLCLCVGCMTSDLKPSSIVYILYAIAPCLCSCVIRQMRIRCLAVGNLHAPYFQSMQQAY